ncbi:hypothetical protein [Roseivirga sp.]|uniref:hypothetical protein n=1 Tax=Roseivirga sp. TaxID=1964215 RepID=UPI003B8DCD93
MNKPFYFKPHFFTLLLTTCVFLSCSSSDDVEDTPETDPEPGANELSWDGQIYKLNDGIFIDYGVSDEGYQVEIGLTDAMLIRVIDGDDQELQPDENGIEYLMGFILSSSSAIEFTIGEYTFSNTEELGTSTFTADWLIDRTNNNEFEDPGDFTLSALNGTMTISGTLPDLIISFDLSMGQKNLKGNFSHSLQYFDQRD